MKPGFLLTSFVTGRTIRYNTLINDNPLDSLQISLTFEKHIALYCHTDLQNNVFVDKKYMRDYIQLYF